MAADSLRYWCLKCRRPLSNDASLKDRDRRDTVTYNGGTHELRHDRCDGIVSMSWREAQAR